MSIPVTLTGSDDAEHAVLASSLLSTEALETSIEILRPDDFFSAQNRITFDVMRQMYSAGVPIDMITLSAELEKKDLLDRVGGAQYIEELASRTVFTANISRYANIVRENSIRRKLSEAGQEISRLVFNYDKDIPTIMEEAEKTLYDAAQNRSIDNFRHVKEIIPSVMKDIDQRVATNGQNITGYYTGYTDLTKTMGALQPGSLTIIAARPSMGKTALAMNIAQFGGGKSNAPVLVFSLEMPADQLLLRMVSAESEVNLSRISQGLIDSAEFEKVRQAFDTVAKRNIYISDATQLSATELMGKCRRFKNRHPDLALVVVDYLQLMTSGKDGGLGRQQEVSDISRMLKATAREVNCPVVALSQLSREAEKRPDKKPQLADLRDSGAIEQDADVVMLLFREDYYSDSENNDLKDSKADVRIAKNRNGSTGVIHLTFRRENTRFYNFGEI